MLIDHRLLHGMQRPLLCLQTFRRHQYLAVDRRQKANAGIDGAIDDRAAVRRKFAEHHRARATIALRAAFFRARAAGRVAQILENRGGRRRVADRNHVAIQYEAHGLAISFTHRSQSPVLQLPR